MISDMSKDLFHKAVAMSGTAFNPWSMCQLENLPERMATLLGWNGEGGIDQAMKELRNASSTALIKAQKLLIGGEELFIYIFIPFGPTIEPYRSQQCFVDKHPVLMSMDAWSRTIPLLIGGCSNKGLLLYKVTRNDPKMLKIYSENAKRLIPIQIVRDKTDERCKQSGQYIKKFYFGITEPSLATLDANLLMMGDRDFWHGIHRTLTSRNNFKDSGRTYLYRFDVVSKRDNLAKVVLAWKNLKGFHGSCHGDDCFFLFKTAFNGKRNAMSKEFIAMDRMVSIWTSFASNGHPDVDFNNSFGFWEPIKPDKPIKCLNIGDELQFIDLPETERMGVWNAIYEKFEFSIIK